MEMVIGVGCAGSGKSTYYNNNLSDTHIRISQDEMGKRGHLDYLNTCLNNHKNVFIDRMNFNVEQRSRYIKLAEKHGYTVKIRVITEPYSVCFYRIKNREQHENLNSDTDEKTIHKVLRFFYKAYEYPTYKESSIISNIEYSKYDPYMLDLTETVKDKRVLVFGDIHGCCYDFLALLRKVGYNKHSDIVIAVGDIVDKGDNIQEVLDFFRHSNNFYTVRGNHEDKLMRYCRGNNVSLTHGLEKSVEQLHFDERLSMYLEDLPYIIKFNDNYVFHGGVNPFKDIREQNKEVLLYGRNWNKETGKFNDASDPFWFEYYNESDTYFYGHHVHRNIKEKNTYALDGGCVYGENDSELRCAIVENGDIKIVTEKGSLK